MASLTPREKDRIMNDLIKKLKEESLEEQEAIKLRGLLEERKTEAFNLGDFALAVGIIFLLAGLIGYLSEKFYL
jgi:hypothetical protein